MNSCMSWHCLAHRANMDTKVFKDKLRGALYICKGCGAYVCKDEVESSDMRSLLDLKPAMQSTDNPTAHFTSILFDAIKRDYSAQECARIVAGYPGVEVEGFEFPRVHWQLTAGHAVNSSGDSDDVDVQNWTKYEAYYHRLLIVDVTFQDRREVLEKKLLRAQRRA